MGSVRTITVNCLPLKGEAVPPSHTLALIRNKGDKAEGKVGGGRLWSLGVLSVHEDLGSPGGAEASFHKREQPLRPHLSGRLLDAEERRWLVFNEACTLQKSFLF